MRELRCAGWREDTQQGTLATGVARDCGDVGSVAGWPSGRERNGLQPGQGATELGFPRPAPGEMQSEAARRAGDPSHQSSKTRRLRVLVITVPSPRPIRAVQRARLRPRCRRAWDTHPRYRYRVLPGGRRRRRPPGIRGSRSEWRRRRRPGVGAVGPAPSIHTAEHLEAAQRDSPHQRRISWIRDVNDPDAGLELVGSRYSRR